jgi:hypothetical protein
VSYPFERQLRLLVGRQPVKPPQLQLRLSSDAGWIRRSDAKP